MRHLTEEERHSLADGSLPRENQRVLETHVAHCADCANDVARLRAVVARARHVTSPAPNDMDLAALWPGIRSRIGQSQIVNMHLEPTLDATGTERGAPPRAATRRVNRRPMAVIAAMGAIGAMAATITVVAVARRHGERPVDSPTGSSAASGRPERADSARPIDPRLRLVRDSIASYENESRVLLNRLELQRAMLRPDALVSIDRDLRVIDRAITELEASIASDPANPALRALLASSYRQKIDLLKRASNAT